ncbi:hypothetical protein INT43_005685 [Umbelopsis isabellina]|uniref:Uncharacterized protein n=1 Tax=Mortierella isabellina TaxID=91625 RepID=A0A8H7PMJ7_MORIS|nr:hypothetical protein INT43_005685 [Umbelopsis isabellina]
MKFDNGNSSKDQSRTTAADYVGSPTLANNDLITLLIAMETEPPYFWILNADNAEHPFHSLPMDEFELEALRMEIVRRRFEERQFQGIVPIRAFKAWNSHPLARKHSSNKLLKSSKNPTKRLKATTISTWLRNLMRLSTSQKPVPSVRSVASDLALTRKAPLSDVVTMGNWSSSEVFDNHYRRQRLQRQNLTNFVIHM